MGNFRAQLISISEGAYLFVLGDGFLRKIQAVWSVPRQAFTLSWKDKIFSGGKQDLVVKVICFVGGDRVH